MQTSSCLLLLTATALLAGSAAVAQNPAPVKNDTGTHVSNQEAKTATAQAAAAKASSTTVAPEGEAKVLDSVVAIVNGDVLLESDVQEEQRLESLQMPSSEKSASVTAAQHLVTRTLILQQMKAQQETPEVSAAQIQKAVGEVRKEMPGCAAAHCETEAGWVNFLKQRGLTPEEVNDDWRQRLIILGYLDLRFQAGIRIPTADMQKYYETSLVPEFQKKHQAPPPFKTLEPRIKEVLMQQQVSKQIDEWEATLRQQGTVQILVPAYGQSTNNDDDDTGGGA